MLDYLNNEKDPLLDPLIKSYYQINVDLIRTIGIKSTRSALAQNNALITEYGDSIVNPLDKTTWKYYLNLSGEYHSTDKEMKITSLDTLQLITFNKENLASNINTAKEYQYGSRYYRTLVNQYPEQEDLILGILIPCDIQKAIDAEDGTILRYDSNLVEEHEYSLIYDLQEAIKRHISRWYIDAYSIVEDYYLMSYYALLYLFMVSKLFNLRDVRRNTYEVHSFHVKMFLRGYMNIDQQYSYLTRKQALYLYRNLPRLTKNMGYDSQFNELMNKLLSPRNIQMVGYSIRQTNEIDTDYTPVTTIVSESLNTTGVKVKTETLSIEDLISKEGLGLYGTKDYYDTNKDKVLKEIKNQNQSKVLTKDIFTEQQVKVNVFSLNQNDINLTHWGYMAAENLYTANITFTNPRTGTLQSLSAKNAFIYLQYLAFNYTSYDMAQQLASTVQQSQLDQLVKLNEILVQRKITVFPTYFARRHVTHTALSINSLLQLVQDDYRERMTPIAQTLINDVVSLSNTNTAELFSDLTLSIYLAYNRQHGLVNQLTDPIERGYARNMVYKLYQDSVVSLIDNTTTIDSFLSENHLDSYDTIGTYLPQLFVNLYNAGTGSSINLTSDLKNTAEALITIIKSLTSYNLQYIELDTKNDLETIQLEPCMINGRMNGGNGVDGYIVNNDILKIGISVQDVTITYL